jgi:hypothetical protein
MGRVAFRGKSFGSQVFQARLRRMSMSGRKTVSSPIAGRNEHTL